MSYAYVIVFSTAKQSLVMPNSDPREGIFYPHLSPMLDSYNIEQLKKLIVRRSCIVVILVSVTVGVSIYMHKESPSVGWVSQLVSVVWCTDSKEIKNSMHTWDT